MKTKPSRISEEELKQYATVDKAYKDKARQLISKELGFEPDIEASIVGEMSLRDSLRRFEEGSLDAEKLEHHVKVYSQVIRTLIPKNAPHQIALLKKHPTVI